MRATNQKAGIWRLSLEQIEATVADHLGPGRVPGNRPGPCLSRQISMYLAKHVGGWSTTQIGRFYNGRHHSTVLHAIAKVQRLRETDESIDALIEVMTASVLPKIGDRAVKRFESREQSVLANVAPNITNLTCSRLKILEARRHGLNFFSKDFRHPKKY
jgi:Bacterial dnaA protein helix-turn-helix